MDKDAIAELFSAFGPVSVRRMFSGYGLFSEGICFSLFLRDEFYLKADEVTIPRFEAENTRPFSYSARGRTITVRSFWRMPERLYDDPDELAEWAREAASAARRVQSAKPKRKTTKVKATPSSRKNSATKKKE